MNGDEPQTPKMFPTRVRSVGTIERRGSFWVLSCDPHVNVFLKRVFIRIDKASDTEIRIRSTPEVDRDLEWIRDRFVLDMERKDEVLLHQGAETMRQRERVAAQVESGTYVPRAFEGMAKPPREYQKVAAALCLEHGSLLLGDSMGLGKTVSALALLSDPRALPAVVITTSAGMCHQWVEKAAEFLPHLRTHVIEGTAPYDLPERCVKLAEKARRDASRRGDPLPPEWPRGAQPDIIMIPDTRIVGWMDILKHRATALVLDECQSFRHSGTEKMKAATAIRARATYCMGLSGTPVSGYGGQYFNVMEMIKPGALGERAEFYREWCIDVQEERKARVADPRAFGLYLRTAGLMLQRSKKDVGRELPPVTLVPTHVDCNMGALDKVKHRVMELARTILRQGGDVLGKSTLRDASGEMDRLMRQATGVAKAPAVAALIRMLVEQGDGPVIVAAWHREVHEILKVLLEGDPEAGVENLHPVFYTGAENDRQKMASLTAFLSGQSKVLVMSHRSTAGIDGIQHVCSTAVIAELSWAPIEHDQFIARIGRDGQTKKVFAYIPLASEGSDPIIADVIGAKRANSEPIIQVDSARGDMVQTDPEHIKRLARSVLDL